MPTLAATSPQAFEAKYRATPDPWNFRSSAYERFRYQALLAALGRSRYGRIFEPGCSIGELTAALADRCDCLIATDVSETALQRARHRCAGLPQVQFDCRDLKEGFEDRFDLIVLSEIGYYFEAPVLTQIAERLCEALTPGGELLAGHWLGDSVDHVLHGDEVHCILQNTRHLCRCFSMRHERFRIDRWVKDE